MGSQVTNKPMCRYFAAAAPVFFLCFLRGLFLPKDPLKIFPRRDRISPLPM
jgi:hypothetical protein